MSKLLEPIPGSTNVSTQVINGLVQSIASGRLRAGDSLPSESEIAHQMGAGISSVREALATLQGHGVISVKHGSGRQVRGLTFSLITDPRIAPVLIDGNMSLAVWEVRQTLEIASSRQAAERATAQDLERIERAAEAMAEAVARGELAVTEDGDFHRAIADAAGNVLYGWLTDSIGVLTAETRLRGLSHPGRPSLAASQHFEIFAAIRDKDADAAEAAIREHLSWQRADALEIIAEENATKSPSSVAEPQ